MHIPLSWSCGVASSFFAATLLLVSCIATNLEEELRITYDQKLAIDKLKQRVLPYLSESYMKDDLHILRWLRATNFNINEAQKRIVENVKWRNEQKLATIHLEDFSDIADDYPYIVTVDKQGQPVFIGFAGEWDIRNAVLTGRATRLIRYINQALEITARMVREFQHQGKNITRLNLLIDLEGFNVPQHACINCLFRILEFLLLYDHNYPGLADRVIFINTPPTVATATEMIRLNANPLTRQALKYYGRDKDVWKRALLEFIDRDKLPTELGGTKKRSELQFVW